MASVFSLTDDCLLGIVSHIDDPSSFYSFALTCQRFLQVARNTRSALHTNLLRAKAEYYVKRYIVEIGHDYDKCCKLKDLLRDSARLTAAKRMITYDKVINAWETNGPVVAKLFTLLRNLEFSEEEGHPRATCFTEHRKFTLHLPSCGKSMVIETSYFGDYGHNYDPELSIHVTCGDLDVKSEGFTRCSPGDYMYWEEEEVRGAVEPMKEVKEFLQKELGETVPPITDCFFIWLCYFFPGQYSLHEEHRLSFKEAARNTKPTPASVQAAIDQFLKYQDIENSLQNLVSGWESGEDQESKNPKMIAETVHLLAQRLERKILECLEKDSYRVYGIANDYDLRKLPKQLLLDLILRTSLEACGYDAGSIANKYVESRVSFRCVGGKWMKVFSSMHGDGASYPSWHEVQIEFTLPDGKLIKLEGEDKPLDIEKLTPVTELLQEGISLRMQGEYRIPKIGNRLTAAYFFEVLEFFAPDGTLGRYNNLISSESEEELSDDESAKELADDKSAKELSRDESEESEQ